MANSGENTDGLSIIKSPGNYGVWWHQNNLGPLSKTPYIIQFGSMKFSKVRLDESMLPHLNDGIEIHFVNSGKYKWVVDGKEIELLPDNLSVTAPWQLNGSPSGKMDIGNISWIIIKPKAFHLNEPLRLGEWSKLSKGFQENIGAMIINENTIVIQKAKLFKKYFLEIKKEFINQDDGYEIVVRNLVENLLVDLYRNLNLRNQKVHEDSHFIEKLTELVSHDFNKKWIIDDLASKFGMGKTKFTYEVKKLTGYPPNSFIINLKIEKAIEMMENHESIKMSDIAFACGFSSLQHFSSIFSQRVGVSPGKFRD